MSNLIEVKVPDIGDFSEVDVIEVLVSVGDQVEVDQSLITVESDKASMEIPSSAAGIVKELKVEVGSKVSEGVVLLLLEASEAAVTDTSEDPAPAAAEPAPEAAATPAAAAPAAAAPQGAASVVEVLVPDIGDFSEVDVIEVLVAEGDTIEVEQSLITVESDKASMEVPSSHAGKVIALKVNVGDKVSMGSLILELETTAAGGTSDSDSAASSAPAATPAPAVTAEPEAAAPASSEVSSTHAYPVQRGDSASTSESPTASYALSAKAYRSLPHASPSVRKFARELGVDLTAVTGTGSRGRIVADDVRQYVKSVLATSYSQGGTAKPSAQTVAGGGLQVLDWPSIDFSKFGEIETTPLSRIKKISGANLHRNWVMIPHVTNNDKADITELESFRKQLNKEYEREGVRFTMLAFLIKAVVAALKKFPEFNASLDGDNLILKKYYHIGFAADTPNGLVVPVLRDADKKSIVEIASEMGELASLAREGKLSPSQMQGGCFTISSLGGIGGTDFTPIINAPEVAILGVSRSNMEPVWDGAEFQPRLMLPLSLSYDHRVIDGALAARFNAYLASLMADYRRVSL